MVRPLRAGIIGLGRIGSRFDEDSKRREIWSHAAAYARVSDVSLAAGADPDRTACAAFQARRGVSRLYAEYEEMLAREELDLVSICLPTPLHVQAALAAARAGIRGIFCEKPLAATVEDGHRIVEQCRTGGNVLAVNYTRRWDRNYLWPRRLLQDGFIGRLERISGIYSGQIFNIGTHLIDAMLMYGGEVEWVTGERSGPPDAEDPSISGLIGFKSGVIGALLALPERTDLVFEIDLLGSEGRIRVIENGTRLELFQFGESPRYGGYREPVPVELANPLPGTERFVEAVQDLVRCVRHGGQPACSGEDALATLETAAALCRSARNGGSKQRFEARVR